MTTDDTGKTNLQNFGVLKELGMTDREASDMAMFISILQHGGHLSPAEQKRKARLLAKFKKLTKHKKGGA